jgi:hypothetical protein
MRASKQAIDRAARANDQKHVLSPSLSLCVCVCVCAIVITHRKRGGRYQRRQKPTHERRRRCARIAQVGVSRGQSVRRQRAPDDQAAGGLVLDDAGVIREVQRPPAREVTAYKKNGCSF